jgi:hypothetical protein
MNNNLNKNNNSIQSLKKNIINFDTENINIIPSRVNLKNNSKKIKKKKSKKNSKEISKKNSKNNKQKRFTYKEFKDNLKFPHGEKYKCISPCYPAETLYYHPLTLQGIKNNYDSCSVRLKKADKEIILYDKCKINQNFDYENYDMFADIFQIGATDDDFLKQIYDVKNINEVNNFLENNIEQLPNYSQIRILNSIFMVYKDYDLFPTKNFIEKTKNIIKKKYDVKINSDEILNKLMRIKHTNDSLSLFELLLN